MTQEIKKIAQNFTVLYAEDDSEIRERMVHILKRVFKEVLVANDGKDALAMFAVKEPDLIISDIQMPNMTGLEMARAIKTQDKDVPIVLITAFSDQKYFLESIDIGIDGYILKPLTQDVLYKTLLKVLKHLEDRYKLNEYKTKELISEINRTTEKTLIDTINLYPNPTIIYDADGKLVAINESSLEMLDSETVASLKDGASINSFLLKKTGFLSDLSELNEKDKNIERVTIKTKSGRKIYIVDFKKIKVGKERLSRRVYTFTDITRLEYERQKNQNYSSYLQNLLKLRKKVQSTTCGLPETEEDGKESVIISQAEQDVLRRSHREKITALVYISEVGDSILDELEELNEIESELHDLISHYRDEPSDKELEQISGKFAEYAKTIANLFEFKDLYFALNQLSAFVATLNTSEINSKRLALLLESIRADLFSWRDMIFVSKTAQDIHYLDSSLFSSCLQIEIDFGNKEIVNEDNDLDLF